MKVKKCNRLPKRLLKNHTVSVCEQNDEDKSQHYQKENFIHLMFERTIRQDEGVNLMTEHDDIHP